MGHPFLLIDFSMSVLLVSVSVSSAQISSSSPIPKEEFAQRLIGGERRGDAVPLSSLSKASRNSGLTMRHSPDTSAEPCLINQERSWWEQRCGSVTMKGLPLKEVSSGNNGQFSFADVSPGFFQLTIESAGFGNGEFAGTLPSGQTYFVPAIVLSVATAVTEVRVKVAANQVEEAEAQIKEQEKQRVLGFIPNFYVSYLRDSIWASI